MNHYKILILGLKQMFYKQIIHTIKQSLLRQLAVMVEENGKKRDRRKKRLTKQPGLDRFLYRRGKKKSRQ